MSQNSPVTPNSTESKLREAMARLLVGKPQNCDGKLTKANLAREAKVSQATMYRAKNILAEWDSQVFDSTPRNAQVSRLEAELSKNRRRVRDLEQHNTELRRQVTAAATVIAELSARLDRPLSKSVTVLDSKR